MMKPLLQNLLGQNSKMNELNNGMDLIQDLPEGCLSHVLSLTTPADVLRSSAVSKQFLSASESDSVWGSFLPADLDQILSQASSQLPQFGSKKELFKHLCRNPVLLCDNTQSLALDKWSGKKSYMLGPRALSIVWGSTPRYWTWVYEPDSRFPEVAELLNVCWLDIKGKIHTEKLSAGTAYGIYFVFRIKGDNNFALKYTPVKVSVTVSDEDGLRNEHHTMVPKRFYLDADSGSERRQRSPEMLPKNRGDGWMEIEMGRYHVEVDGAHDNGAVLEMSLEEIERLNWKHGLVVHGIEIRPLH